MYAELYTEVPDLNIHWVYRAQKKRIHDRILFRKLAILSSAEGERFELSVEVYPLRRFSKPLVSATHPPKRAIFDPLGTGVVTPLAHG